ncbi:MAG: 2-C-methyl-D-erythritol 4-phosphate cytidylyltransferase [Candidatus Kapabacteria bacterium]|nr:2-C-methyl-D-erythritol 4-phosphate cytidylyltransferase [Candidatus Kapabacteria bacterium]
MEPDTSSIGVIIPAAGSGVRFGGDTPKQFLLLAGLPVIIRSVRTALQLPNLATLVIASRPEDLDYVRRLLADHGVSDLRVHVVRGSTERQLSVAEALRHESMTMVQTILVHDAVRPLATIALWGAVARAAESYGAVVPTLPVADTLKRLDQNNAVIETVDRSSVVRVQTPQGFRSSILFAAYDSARIYGHQATDCASLVELQDVAVTAIPGEETNFKITSPYDLEVAEFLFQ